MAKMGNDPADPFARDLWYLEKFFDKLESHATTIPGQAGSELQRLMAEQRATWKRIQSLLKGVELPSENPSEETLNASSEPSQSPITSPRPLLTVGDLLRRK